MKNRNLIRHLCAAPAVVATIALSALNGFGGASPSSDVYPAVVKGDGALAYYRFSDSLTKNLINVNSGSLGAAGNASNDLATITGGVVYSMPGAIAGDWDRAAFYDFTTRTEIPFNSALNTPNTQPFTVESWIYPVSDAVNNGMGVWCNRYTQGTTRQGWVMYQRAPDALHCTSCGPGIGWEFRMYNNQDTSGHLDVTSGVNFQLGKWQHVVVVYDPVQVTNATLTIYIDGVPAATNIWAATDNVTPGYFPCLGDNAVQPNGPPAISMGGYNNANGGNLAGFENPWIGGIDEFAWYPTNLSPARILAHYQSGTNAARSTPYATMIQSDHPAAYLRLNEVAPGPDTAFNIGDARSAAHAPTTALVKHPGTSPLAGSPADGSFSGHLRNGGGSVADIPWLAQNNPDAGVPFSLELWVRPTADKMNPGPAVINNRWKATNNRTGWVIYQRDVNSSYTGSVSSGEGIGYTFRMYTGSGSGGQDIITYVPYNIGEWQHLVFTWEPQVDNGTSLGGAEQWSGTLTAYVNGMVCTNANNLNVSNIQNAIYAANTNVTENGSAAADFAVGAYNVASGGGEEFEGDIDEVAFYNNVVLTPDQILDHYMTATNAHPATNYTTLVMSAGVDYFLNNIGGVIPEGITIPKTYLRFNEPAYFPAANSGSLGHAADGILEVATNVGTGPVGTGFAAPNPAVPLDGAKSWVALNNPAGLEFSGQITLEAWIDPADTQGDPARIISHGPATLRVGPGTGWQLSSNEVFLRIEGAGADYSVGTSDGTTFHGATATVPTGDLGGGNGWIHLVGTFDGTHWNLYRNGVQVASVADGQGPLPVNGPEWALGATGMGWADSFAGSIDEAAIYNTALSPALVQAHYYVGQNGSVSLGITHTGSTLTVSWPVGILQQADAITGPWGDVSGASAPSYNPPAGPTKKFYRVKL